MQRTTPALRLTVATGEVAAVAAPLALVAAIAASPAVAGSVLPTWASALAAGLVAVGAAAATIALLADGLRRRHAESLVSSGAAALLGAGFAAAALGARAIPAVLLVAASGWLIVGLVSGTGLTARIRADVRTAAAIFLAIEAVTAGVLVFPPLEPPFAAAALLTAAGLFAVSGLLHPAGTARIGALLMAGGGGALALAAPGTAGTLAGLAALAAGVVIASIPRAATAVPVSADVDGLPALLLPALSRSVSDGLLLFDGRLRLRDWNPAAATLLGIDTDAAGMRFEDATGMPLGRIKAADGPVVERAPRTGEPMELEVLSHADGIVVLARVPGGAGAGAEELDRLGRELRGTIEELVQARRTIELQRVEIERAASVDPLTGLASRSAIMQRLETEVAQARRYAHPVAVVLIDVDGMASINHEHGFEVGDGVLREVALRHRLRVRGADALGRIAGDAFLAILPHTDEGGAATFADALRRRLAQRPIGTTAGALTVTVSVGVAVMRPAEELDPDGLLTRAEEALASARAAGGDRIALDRLHGLARLEGRRRPTPPEASVSDEATEDTGA